ncbi:MAG: dCTP deaminase [Methylobacter sp.]
MLLSYNELVKLVESGVINAPVENINGSSIDITLHDVIRVEYQSIGDREEVDLYYKENIETIEHKITFRYKIKPREFILASSNETFNLPNNISAEYKLKSSMARNGLEHLNAGWCDAGWNNSRLTLELNNMTRYHDLIIRPNMKIGQVVFFKHKPVPDDASYATKGQYNWQDKVQASKGIR